MRLIQAGSWSHPFPSFTSITHRGHPDSVYRTDSPAHASVCRRHPYLPGPLLPVCGALFKVIRHPDDHHVTLIAAARGARRSGCDAGSLMTRFNRSLLLIRLIRRLGDRDGGVVFAGLSGHEWVIKDVP